MFGSLEELLCSFWISFLMLTLSFCSFVFRSVCVVCVCFPLLCFFFFLHVLSLRSLCPSGRLHSRCISGSALRPAIDPNAVFSPSAQRRSGAHGGGKYHSALMSPRLNDKQIIFIIIFLSGSWNSSGLLFFRRSETLKWSSVFLFTFTEAPTSINGGLVHDHLHTKPDLRKSVWV